MTLRRIQKGIAVQKKRILKLPSAPRIFVLPQHRIVWVQITKNGCTSLLEMLSQLNGSRPWAVEASGYPEWSPDSVIHDPRVHGLAHLEDLNTKTRNAAISEPGWWRFAVVRAPHSRFLSAWTDKVFLKAPGTPHLWSENEDVLTENGGINITATFERFVNKLSQNPQRILADRHFTPQHALLARDLLHDLEIIPLSQFRSVQARLEQIRGQCLTTNRLNESLHLDPTRVYNKHSYGIVADIYREDLNLDPTSAAPIASQEEPLILTKLETNCVHKLRAASMRIQQLSRLAVCSRLTVQAQRLFGLR